MPAPRRKPGITIMTPRRTALLSKTAVLAMLCLFLLAVPALAQITPPPAMPTPAATAPAPDSAPPASISISLNGGPASQSGQVATGLQIVALLTVLSLAPAILVMMTSFTRIVVVLGFVRRALSTNEVPPTQVLIGLSLFLTFFVMAPTWNQLYKDSLRPYFDNRITVQEAFKKAETPVREFLFKNTRKNDLALFVRLAGVQRPRTMADVPTYVLIPSFMVSELQTAFLIGFIIYIPFLIIDMVVSSVLLSMGMMMLPPVIVSLPFKIILFVLVDGWNLIIGSLVRSFS